MLRWRSIRTYAGEFNWSTWPRSKYPEHPGARLASDCPISAVELGSQSLPRGHPRLVSPLRAAYPAHQVPFPTQVIGEP
jgi:hypothetical protein